TTVEPFALTPRARLRVNPLVPAPRKPSGVRVAAAEAFETAPPNNTAAAAPALQTSDMTERRALRCVTCFMVVLFHFQVCFTGARTSVFAASQSASTAVR